MQLKWTPLYASAYAGHMKIVQYLIEERGCNSAVVTAVSSQVLNRHIQGTQKFIQYIDIPYGGKNVVAKAIGGV